MPISSQCAGVPPVCPKCAPAHRPTPSIRVCPCAPPPKGGHTGHTDKGQIRNHSKTASVCPNLGGHP